MGAVRVSPRGRFRQPNILVIMVDQLRMPRWSGSGPLAGLPSHIAQLARAGVSFTRHYTASNDCSPARAALLTGLHTHQTGCMITGASTLDPRFPTWGTMLREHGYRTYWYGKWHLTHGDAHWNSKTGPPGLSTYGFDGGTFPPPDGAPGQGWRVDPSIVQQFEDWYRHAGADGPWCTTVSLVNPHDIAWWWRWSSPVERRAPNSVAGMPANFETPAQLAARRKPRVQLSMQETSAMAFGAVPFDGRAAWREWQAFLDTYVMLQRTVDDHVARVVRTLAKRRSVMANTIVVFTSDHGEYGGAHGLRGKGAGMYEEAVNVPLILCDNTGTLALSPNTVRTQLTSSVDVAPMLLTLATGSGAWRIDPRYAQIAGRPDLVRIAQDPAARGRDYALHATDEVITEFALQPYAAAAPLHVTGVITSNAKYATYSNWRPNTLEPISAGEEAELYDFSTHNGRLETENLAGRSHKEGPLRSTLEAGIRDELHAPLPRMLGVAQRTSLDEYHRVAARLRTASTTQRLNALENLADRHQNRKPPKARLPPTVGR